jgi:AcrR family transcriptional regulator
MSPRLTPKGASTRQAIVQAAYRLFLEQGYHATSARDIARAAGLSTGGLYTHFADKEQIFIAVLKEFHPFLHILPAMLAAQGETVEALIYDIARRMVESLGLQRVALNLIFIEIVEFQGGHFSEMFPQYFQQLSEVFARVNRMLGPAAIPLPLLARSFFGLFFSFFLTSIALNDRLPSDEKTLDAFVDLYLHGILPRPTQSESSAHHLSSTTREESLP